MAIYVLSVLLPTSPALTWRRREKWGSRGSAFGGPSSLLPHVSTHVLSMILRFKEIHFMYNIMLRCKPTTPLVFDQRDTNLSLLGQKKKCGFPIGFFFFPCRSACGILVPRPGIESMPLALEVQSLNHWTAREKSPHWVFWEMVSNVAQKYHPVSCTQRPISET